MSSENADDYSPERYESMCTKFIENLMTHQGFHLTVPAIPPKLVGQYNLNNDSIYRIRRRILYRTKEMLEILGVRHSISEFNLALKIKEEWETDDDDN